MRNFRKLFCAILLLTTVVINLDSNQYVRRSWPQTEIQRLVDTTVVTFVNNETNSWLGTGVIIDRQGTILTAAHVVAGIKSPTILILTSHGEQYFCERLALDHRVDLGVIRIKSSAQKFPYAKVQSSDYYRVGQDILVIGNPYGMFWTVTKGTISRVYFYLPAFSWRFDTDARVNPGNSGGPAFNEDGEVIGIVSAMHVDLMGRPIGIGVVVPISEIHRFLLRNASKINKPWPKPRLRLGDVKVTICA